MMPGGSGRWFYRLLTYLGLVLGARGPRAAASPWGYLPKSAGLPTRGAPHLLRQHAPRILCRILPDDRPPQLFFAAYELARADYRIGVIAVLAIPAVAKTERMGAAHISPNHVVI
jgi:hypothetical protein